VQSWRRLAGTGAAFGLLAVGLGAVGAHAIPLPDAAAQRLWRIALEMHLFHTVAMLGIAALAAHMSSPAAVYGGFALALGTALFSGSLYLRAAGVEMFPSVLAPVGGSLLMLAWLWLLIIFLGKNKD